MTLPRSFLFLIAALVCFAVALACALSLVHSNENAWADGGLLALALSFLP